jgi:uncharacterized integral membrane protein
MQGNPGDLSYLPNSSSFGLPTAFDFSNWQVPQALLVLIIAVIGIMIIMHLLH